MFKSNNCSADTGLGDSSINEDADVVFGNAITSRILLEPDKIIINLSKPKQSHHAEAFHILEHQLKIQTLN